MNPTEELVYKELVELKKITSNLLELQMFEHKMKYGALSETSKGFIHHVQN